MYVKAVECKFHCLKKIKTILNVMATFLFKAHAI